MPCVRVRKQMKVGWPSKGGKPEKGNKIDRNIGTNVRGLAANFAGFWGCLCAAGPVRENDTYCKRSIRVVSMFRCAGAKCPEGAGGAGGETGGSWYQRDVATCVFTWSGTSSPISLLWIHIFCSSRRFSAWQLIHS